MKAMDAAVKQYNLSWLSKFFAKTGDKYESMRLKIENMVADEEQL